MAIPYERIVEQDLHLGHGDVTVTMPAGGTATGTRVGLHTFTDILNVQDFGAVGDGVSDDTAAIRATLAAVPAIGGGVFFPAGTYRVIADPGNASIETGAILEVASVNTRVFGVGRGSVIQVAAGSPAYTTILGGTRWSVTDVSGLEVDHLTFDHNVAQVSIAGVDVLNTQNTVRVGVGSNIAVHHCEIRNASSFNNIVINGPLVTLVSVCDNVVTNFGDDPTHLVHDASVIYVHATRAHVSRNTFVSAGPGSPGATTAIETHGTHITISHNTVVDFFNGMNVTGVHSADTQGVTVTGNVITGSRLGIRLWSKQSGSHTSGFGLNGVTVVGNTITLAAATVWPSVEPGLEEMGIGFVDAGPGLDITNVLIADNVISHPLEASAFANNTISCAIGWVAPAITQVLSHAQILHNTIVNFPMPGLRFSCALTDVRIAGNLFVNCGSTLWQGIAGSSPLRQPLVIISTVVSDLVIQGNTFHDSLSEVTWRPANFIYLYQDNTVVAAGVALIGNVFLSTGSAMTRQVELAIAAATPLRPYLEGVIPGFVPTASVGQKWALGSRVLDATTGDTWTVKADAFTWSRDTHLTKRLYTGGSAISTGDIALSGWGAGAVVNFALGTDQTALVEITAGAAPSVNPSWTLTFVDGAYDSLVTAIVAKCGGDGANDPLQWSGLAATLLVTVIGTPVVGKVYQYAVLILPR